MHRLGEKGERFFLLGFYTLCLNPSCLDLRLLNFGPGHQNLRDKITKSPMIVIYRDVSCTTRALAKEGRQVAGEVSWHVRGVAPQRCPHDPCAHLIRERKRKAKPSYFLCEQIIYMSSFFQHLQRISSTLSEDFSLKEEKKKKPSLPELITK